MVTPTLTPSVSVHTLTPRREGEAPRTYAVCRSCGEILSEPSEREAVALEAMDRHRRTAHTPKAWNLVATSDTGEQMVIVHGMTEEQIEAWFRTSWKVSPAEGVTFRGVPIF